MSGFDESNSGYTGASSPAGVPHPTRKATANSTAPFAYSRRYLDWNRRTFEFHAVGDPAAPDFDEDTGLATTALITQYREELNLGEVYGCVPQDYCKTCAPFNSSGSIFPLLSEALAQAVVRDDRRDRPRFVVMNTGGVRFDMYQGPFTYDDNFIVSPFRDVFLYYPDVPYALASSLLDRLNAAGASQKRDLGVMPAAPDLCVDPVFGPLSARDDGGAPAVRRRQVVVDPVPGYTTTDDFGTDGDDTAHSAIPSYQIPDFFQGIAGAAADADVVDLVFVDL